MTCNTYLEVCANWKGSLNVPGGERQPLNGKEEEGEFLIWRGYPGISAKGLWQVALGNGEEVGRG